ncbi:MAG: DsbA family oxidoreductase [Mariniphaga sp.]|nr:DsbA family oxidoreductase [Mariniphaga sp.]
MKSVVTVYSDNICPFCTIGAKRLRILQNELDFDVHWRPFEIHPDTPKEGKLTAEYFKNHDAGQMKQYIENFGKDVGMKLNGKLLANSKLSLAANNFAREKGKFPEFHEAVFKANFEDGKNIGEITVLLDLAEGVGIDTQELKTYLEDEANLKKVDESSKEAQMLGITGVPTFILNNKVLVGAQPIEVIREFIQNNS